MPTAHLPRAGLPLGYPRGGVPFPPFASPGGAEGYILMNAFTLAGDRAPGKGAKEMAARSAILPMVDFGCSLERRCDCSRRDPWSFVPSTASTANRLLLSTKNAYTLSSRPRSLSPFGPAGLGGGCQTRGWFDR